MSTTHTLTLAGCAPVPLAHYLKAFGILRLLSEDKKHGDPYARGRWHRDRFELSSTLDREALITFFLEKYVPTPFLSPWNAGSGFYYQEEKLGKDPKTGEKIVGKKIKTGVRNQGTAATKVIARILASDQSRLKPYQEAIQTTKTILASKGLTSAPETTGADKDELLMMLRSHWPDSAVRWLDCVAVLTASRDAKSSTGLRPSYTSLLGSGANDGNADFTSNFMQRIIKIMEAPLEDSTRWLAASLFGENYSKTRVKGLAGQFAPGTAGGPNSTSGFTGKFSVNPWDFVLLIEGALFFAATAVRQHGSTQDGSVACPFCVSVTGVGYASSSTQDEIADKSATEEMWLPLWSSFCSTNELMTVFGEGRAQVRGRNARTGVDFAQAVVSLGVDRGIDEFQRVGFLVRNGKSVFATPLTRVAARRGIGVDLLSDVDDWLNRFRRAATKDTAPLSVRRALSALDSRILDLCVSHSDDRLMRVFTGLGRCEAALSRSLRWVTSQEIQKSGLRPLSGLRPAWLDHGQQCVEFRLAASLASLIGRLDNKALPMRCHLEQVSYQPKNHRYDWADPQTNDVQWNESSLPDVLNAILARRLIKNEEGPKLWREVWSSLNDIKSFIESKTDDQLLSDLLWSMSLINWRERTELNSSTKEPQPVAPTLYGLLKLCFPPVQSAQIDGILPVPVVPAIHRHAAQGNGDQAATMAIRRLRASGYQPALRSLPVRGDYAHRTAAALLFPISDQTLTSIHKQTTRSDPASANA